MLKKVMIKIKTERIPAAFSLFDEPFSPIAENGAQSETPEISEMTVEGKLKESLGRVELKYTETELSGMGGSLAAITFSADEPSLVTLMRSGMVNTALVFEEGKRNICAYNTPFMPFEVCVHAFKIKNKLLTDGTLYIDYAVEIRGADAERCKLTVSVREVTKIKLPKE